MLRKLLRTVLPWHRREAASTPRPPSSVAAEQLSRALERQARGDFHGAEQVYRSILAGRPEDASTLHLLGHVLTMQAKTAEAVSVLSRAAELAPDDADVSFNLGCALHREGQRGAAERAFRRAVDLRPGFVAAWLSLAGVMTDADDLDAAEDCFQRVLALEPGFAEAHYNYGNLLHREGRIDEAVSSYRTAVKLKPDFMRAHSNLVYALNFSDKFSPEQIFNEHREWGRRHADPLTPMGPAHPNPRTTGRTLRVGYVSPNFRDHAVTYFFEPTLTRHDPSRVTAYCYSDVERPDAYTRRLRRAAHAWREIAGQDDQSVAELVRRDGIDILVDLTGHTDNHRLLVFARKPAPVQVTWNGYANTTGMLAMDYRITDARADPPGMTEHLHTERLVRLPGMYMAFMPQVESPEVSAAPVLEAGRVTFGSLNALSKVTTRAIRVWSDILSALPGSRLLMVTVPAGRARQQIVRNFAEHGIDGARLEFLPRLPVAEFLAAHARVDVALDPFPFNGTTTTCQTLWMGVPVVTLAGKSHVSRVGASMLAAVGLEQCVAQDENDYVRKALALAAQPARLQELRHDLRKRVSTSPLLDGTKLTRDLEGAYATMWEIYCRNAGTANA
jgi:predicted O-linked N-acetylglucosamine transferase (SPINDLY family)